MIQNVTGFRHFHHAPKIAPPAQAGASGSTASGTPFGTIGTDPSATASNGTASSGSGSDIASAFQKLSSDLQSFLVQLQSSTGSGTDPAATAAAPATDGSSATGGTPADQMARDDSDVTTPGSRNDDAASQLAGAHPRHHHHHQADLQTADVVPQSTVGLV